jgi:hypothetical protein
MKLNITTDDVKVERKARSQSPVTVELFAQFDAMHKSAGWKKSKVITILDLTDNATRSTVASALRAWATKRNPYGDGRYTVRASKSGTVKLEAKRAAK